MRALVIVLLWLSAQVACAADRGSATPGNFVYGSMPRANSVSLGAALTVQEAHAIRWVNQATVDVTLVTSAIPSTEMLPAARLSVAYAGYSIYSPTDSRRGHDLGTIAAELWFSRVRAPKKPQRGERFIGVGIGVLGQPDARIPSSPNFFVGSIEPTLVRKGFRILLDYTQRHRNGYLSVLSALGVAEVQSPGVQYYLAGSHIMIGGGWLIADWVKVDIGGYFEMIRLGCLASVSLMPTPWMSVTGGVTAYGAFDGSFDPRLELKFWF